MLTALREWSQKKLRAMLKDPRSMRGFRSAGQLEKGIGADRSTTERLLLSIGARKALSPFYPHVWTAPSWQGLSSPMQIGRCAHVFGLLRGSHDRWP